LVISCWSKFINENKIKLKVNKTVMTGLLFFLARFKRKLKMSTNWFGRLLYYLFGHKNWKINIRIAWLHDVTSSHDGLIWDELKARSIFIFTTSVVITGSLHGHRGEPPLWCPTGWSEARWSSITDNTVPITAFRQ